MTVIAMNRSAISKIGTRFKNPLRAEARYKRRLCRALQAWPSGEALAIDLSEMGIERSTRICNAYRAGTSMPPAWLCERLLTMSIITTRQQIRALEQRLEELGAVSCEQGE